MGTPHVVWWPKPEAGDIVWCHFPYLPATEPGPKPRPALLIRLIEHNAQYRVLVAYGTSQKTNTLRSGEFLIRQDGSAAFKISGLSFDTKFSFVHMLELDYSDQWFKVPPTSPYGQTPKIGTLHAIYSKAAHTAYLASQT
jgi:hypothetical protein